MKSHTGLPCAKCILNYLEVVRIRTGSINEAAQLAHYCVKVHVADTTTPSELGRTDCPPYKFPLQI